MLAEQQQQLTDLFTAALASVGADGVPITFERPKAEAHGDIATNVALHVARAQKKNPREVAAAVAAALRAASGSIGLIETVEVAGPGFINLRLAPAAKQRVVQLILDQLESFGTTTAHRRQTVMVEFVSANPTGPLHLGHARQAALGDALGNLLAAQGWQVTREFYYNDAGVQIANLALSVQARAKEQLGQPIDFPESGYRGEYIAEIGRDYLARTTIARDGVPVTASGDANDLAAIERFAVACLRNEQDRDLAALGVQFDSFFLESSLYRDGKVDAAVDAMGASGMTYEDNGALWLRTTAPELSPAGEPAGQGGPAIDDKDRVMRKSDGTFTYFVPDVAYHITKLERGYDKVINVQGSDHYGTVARVRAGLRAAAKALGVEVPPGYPDYLLHKMLRITKGGEEVKMSKRAGTYVTLRDLLDWVGRDATRFFLVSRKADAEFVFDVDLALSQSDENPVYYVQYAHARICSVLAQAEEKGFSVPDIATARGVALSPLQSAREQSLMNRLADYPAAIESAASELAPHQMPSYLKELAADFHAYYNAERVLVDDEATRVARLALLLATRQVLANGLQLLGVSAPQRM
ncbi:MAG: arginine--tRNA ligase [Burkholderiaceae bacterium]|nr:arginine--tRNA ligase [Burkholderiaceae bacterium]